MEQYPDFVRLRAFDEQWTTLIRPFRMADCFAPLNMGEEKTRFQRAWEQGRPYNPQFVYAPLPEFPVGQAHALLRQLRPEQSRFDLIYWTEVANWLTQCQVVRRRSPGDVTGVTALLYGQPDGPLLTRAATILAQNQVDVTAPEAGATSLQAAQRLRQAIAEHGWTGWEVIVAPRMNARMAVDSLRRQVRVREDARFTALDLERLVVHEIGVHARRAVNGFQQPLPILGRGLPGYLATEEGLAVWSEQQAGVADQKMLRTYAARVLAAHAALHGSFWEACEAVAPGVGLDAAFEIVARAKRGLTDTAQPGAHLKDIVYLRGYLAVSRHLAERPEDLPLLLLGKIGLADLDWVRELVAQGVLTVPVLQPTWVPARKDIPDNK